MRCFIDQFDSASRPSCD